MKYHLIVLIIWRSQVQALAGPRSIKKGNQAVTKRFLAAFSLHTKAHCTQFAHSFREVLIINDKRNTPVNCTTFHLVSFFNNYCLIG